MRPRAVERALWLASAGFLVTAGVSVWDSSVRDASGRLEPLPQASANLGTETVPAESAARIIAGDPFRLVRHPSPIAYRPELEGVAPPPPPPKPPHPGLVLTGIVGGPPWEALLDGIPGREGSTLVHQGQVLGALRIRAVTGDSLIVQGEDTTWRLGIKRSWP